MTFEETESVKDKEKETLEEELAIIIINSQSSCSENYADILRQIRNRMPVKIVEDLLQEEFYQAKVVETIACTMGTMFYTPSLDQDERTELFRNWFSKMEYKKIPFYFETPYKMGHKINIIHAAFTASQVTNKLREHVPNFIYFFGMAFVPESNPRKNSTSEYLSEMVPYAFYENVNKDIPLAKFAKTATFHELQNIFLQVFYSLQLAYETYDYTNYKLNSRTVMIRKLRKKVQLVYFTENGEEYLLTNKIAIISDLSFSHFDNGKSYGRYLHYGGDTRGVKADRSHPFYDIHSLIFSTYIFMSEKTKHAFFFRVIFPYFTNQFLDNISDYFSFFGEGFEELDYYFIINILRKEKTPFLRQKPFDVEIWNCQKKNCYQEDSIIRMLTPPPTSPPDAYELYERLQLASDQERTKVLEDLKNNYSAISDNYEEEMTQFFFAVNTTVQKLTRIKENIQRNPAQQELFEVAQVLSEYSDRVYQAIFFNQIFEFLSENVLQTVDNERWIEFLWIHARAIQSTSPILEWIENRTTDEEILGLVVDIREKLRKILN
jgi:hypothetical protein